MWYTKSEVSTASDQKSEALLKNINCTTSSSKQLVSLLLRCQRASHCPGSKVSFSPRDRHSLGIEADLKAWSFKLCDYKKYTQKWSGRSAAGQQRRLNYFTSVRSRLTSDTNNNNTELHRHVMMCLWGPKKNTTLSFLYPKRYVSVHIEEFEDACHQVMLLSTSNRSKTCRGQSWNSRNSWRKASGSTSGRTLRACPDETAAEAREINAGIPGITILPT